MSLPAGEAEGKRSAAAERIASQQLEYPSFDEIGLIDFSVRVSKSWVKK